MFLDDDSDSYDFEPPPELKEWLDHQKAKGIEQHAFIEQRLGQHYILENGKIRKASFLEAAACWSKIENRRVDFTTIDDVEISTVFMPLDCNILAFLGRNDDTRPYLFETMIFGGFHDSYCKRYATMGEAKVGHWEAVDLVKGNKNGNESD